MDPETSVSNSESSPSSQTAARVGAPVAFALAALAAVGFTIGVLTPPHSGPWCAGDCISYPFTDAARFFPRDYWWMIPGTLLAPLFMVVAVCAHYCAPGRAKPFSLLGVCFAAIATALVPVIYFIQLVLAQAGLVHHQFVAMFTMYNPSGLFTAMEEMGYLMLAAAFFCVSRAIPRESLAAVIACWVMSTAALIAFVAFAGMVAGYGPDMGTPFEVAIITTDWIALVVAGIAVGLWFRGMAARAARK
jgi:hypothetical protein